MNDLTINNSDLYAYFERELQKFTAKLHKDLLARDCTSINLSITMAGTAGSGLELKYQMSVEKTTSYAHSGPSGGSLTRVAAEAYRRAGVDLGNVLQITRSLETVFDEETLF